MLVRPHTDSLTAKTTVRDIEDAIIRLDSDLANACETTMGRVQSQSKDTCKLGMSVSMWISLNGGTFKLDGLQPALATHEGDVFFRPSGIVKPDLLLTACADLWKFRR